jgi:geranylgeranyl pyrophosphate synthase
MKKEKYIPVLRPIRSRLESVQKIMDETARQAKEPLSSILSRVLIPGKCLRPALVVLVGEMFGRGSHQLAAAVELLHAATLVHDDMVDRSSLRRGRKTLHRLLPAGATVLAGDYLLACSVALVAGLNQPEALKILSQTLGIMCEGEIGQILDQKKNKTNREKYFKSIRAKTASLYSAACEMAGVLAKVNPSQKDALKEYGLELGIAFQIMDDILDFTGDEKVLGKPPGSDLRQGQLTLPAILYLENSNGSNPVRKVLSGKRNEKLIKEAIQAVGSSPAIEASLKEARAHARQSQQVLNRLPENKKREILFSLSDYVVERRF